MPVYDFVCNKCGILFTEEVKWGAIAPCRICKSTEPVEKKFPAPRIGKKYGEMKRAEHKGYRVREMEHKEIKEEKEASTIKK